ncbi:MAG: Rrf2 family transcriptional regulator [Rhodospirillaceae bacterium]|nr:Rrf2 family transcriptional regulator [Rhodospirillaceae bacterium]
MRLTVHTDYALRVLMYVAMHQDRLSTISEISTVHRISRNHLMKVVHQLGVAGYVETVRGQHGGLRLAKKPQDIVIGDVVRTTEPDLALVSCFESGAACALTAACKLKRAISDALKAFLAVLDGYTVADLVHNRGALTRLLGSDAKTSAAGAAHPV